MEDSAEYIVHLPTSIFQLLSSSLMPLQDLTPQLRTRLSRLERLVGLFVTVATLLLLAGLGYYVYHLAERKGWFLEKLPYFTLVHDAAGLKVGDPAKLMGFEVGDIIEITPQPPEDVYHNVYVRFRVKEPYFGYLWVDSRAKVASADFLGKRFIEVTKGTNGAPSYPTHELKELSVADAERLAGSNNVVVAQEIYDRANNLLVRVKRPCALQTWGRRIAETKGSKRARVAVARKLAVLLHRLWQSETEFRWT